MCAYQNADPAAVDGSGSQPSDHFDFSSRLPMVLTALPTPLTVFS